GAHVPGAGLRGRRRGRRRHGHGRGDALELRPVRRDHREGWTADAARGRVRARVLADLVRVARRLARVIDRDDVLRARDTIAGRLHRTPVLSSRSLGPDVFLKAELFQKTGSSRPRAALNKLASLSDEEKRRGVITISAGNHAQAVAWACASE